jgi:DNA repair protein RecO (recombination protein O)
MASYKTKAVVLKTYDLGEADKIVKLFSGEHGPIDSVAKGARKIKSKFSGRLELFNFVDLEMSRGKNLDIITQADIIKNFPGISLDFNKFIFCQMISDVMLKTHLSSENTGQVFKLIYLCFNEINSTSEINDIKMAGSFFIAKFLKITGYAPRLAECQVCGHNIIGKDNFNFSIKLGGIVCDRCHQRSGNNTDSGAYLNSEKFGLLKYLFLRDLKTLKGCNWDASSADEVFKLLENYLKYHAELNINISSFLKRI